MPCSSLRYTPLVALYNWMSSESVSCDKMPPTSIRLILIHLSISGALCKGKYIYYLTLLEIVILSVCLSVCMSVRLRHTRALWRNEGTYYRYFDTTWKSNHFSLLIPTVVIGDVPFHLKFALKWPTPFKKLRLRAPSAYNVSILRATENVQLSQIGSWPRDFQRAIDEVRTLPLYNSPKGAQKANLSVFWIKM